MNPAVIMLLICAGMLLMVTLIATVGLWWAFRHDYIDEKENDNE